MEQFAAWSEIDPAMGSVPWTETLCTQEGHSNGFFNVMPLPCESITSGTTMSTETLCTQEKDNNGFSNVMPLPCASITACIPQNSIPSSSPRLRATQSSTWPYGPSAKECKVRSRLCNIFGIHTLICRRVTDPRKDRNTSKNSGTFKQPATGVWNASSTS